MAKGKHVAWHEPANLEKLTNWAANGYTDTEIAKSVGISRNTYYKWIAAYGDIDDAIKKGRAMCLQQVENTFFRRAMGLCEETSRVKEMEQKLVDGKLVTVHQVVKETTRTLAPDTTALLFYLKNKGGYRSEPDAQVNVDVDVAPVFTYERAE
jgi:transposase-like protein